MSQCPALAPSATPVYTLQFPVQPFARVRSNPNTSDTCKVEPPLSPLVQPESMSRKLLSPIAVSSAASILRDRLISVFSAKSPSSSSSSLLFCMGPSDVENETIILDLARVAAGSDGAQEMVSVVEEKEEEIKMEDEHDDEEETRGVWKILLFCSILVMAYNESDEVQIHL
ncbi:hypothetical protein BGZ96_005665 [Linnemannia gamsii]|uniref:Uncharacterized protein n=1 Tax=Linnemannia gamsii TaxID=64522 RepID=A0ABQ7K5B6_9FUNG|nr:hypothetical protein BGZ96_005665 [Linnemannia gamsii]